MRRSFDRVFENLQKIRVRYPRFYKERCTVLACYDTGTNLPIVAKFFDSNVNFLPSIGRISLISQHFTDWYSRYSSQQKAKFNKSFEMLQKRFFSQLINHEKVSSFLDVLFGTPFRMIMMRRRDPSSRPSFLPYTGACIPGTKIAVDPQGDIHCCEKMNEQFPIGDVQNGLSIEKIATLMDSYRRQIYPECFDCPVTKLCPVCYAIVAGNGRFERSPSNLCLKIRESVKRKFEDLWTLFEASVKESDIFHSEGGVPWED